MTPSQLATQTLTAPTGATAPEAGAPTDVATNWIAVGRVDDWTPWTGRAALVHGQQVAVFRLGAPDTFVAIANHDPCSGANVLSRGIVGDLDGVVYVASPIRKQRFVLATGDCLDADVRVATHAVLVADGLVHVAAPVTD